MKKLYADFNAEWNHLKPYSLVKPTYGPGSNFEG